ncbi:substrate-binding domain-containing protein [Modicisalibacter luteus]|uniref:substrate-binding domain-containing protein n=1 Tax=Modicisalibacter luteus TaxID=453962 RepID=UPI00363BF523
MLLDRSLGDVDADVVGLDNASAIDLAIEHLVEQGYRHMLFVSEPPQGASSRQLRLDRFHQRLAQMPELTGDATCLPMQRDAAELRQRLGSFLAGEAQAPRAILCANGNVTLQVALALNALHARLGETGLLGIDELDWCALAGPGITTLAQPTEAIGRATVESLMQRLEPMGRQAPPRRTEYAARLIARGSTQR